MNKVKDLIFKTYNTASAIALMVVAVLILASGCSNDDELISSQHGYVQFKLYKEASYESQTETRSSRLELLSDAKKMEVVMQYSGSTITQTLVLEETANKNNSEFGLRSKKLQLLPGEYTIIGYYLFNNLDEEIFSGELDDNTFTVEERGLVVKDIPVDVSPRGMASFKLVKEFIKTRAEEGTSYPFNNIKVVDLTVKNSFTQLETTIKNITVKHKTGFKDGNDDNDLFGDKNAQISYALCDTVVWLKAGSYQLTRYTTYSDKTGKTVIETNDISTSKTFVIQDNKETKDIEVPVQLKESSEFIKDYIALKEIWEALDGPNWKYYGEAAPMGSNWNFNKDIDMWGQQPGVGLDANGRVGSLNISGFGAKGEVPDAIGQLTEVKFLAFGTHDEMLGGHMLGDLNANMTENQLKDIRYHYANTFLVKDGREALSDILQEAINRDPNQKKIVKSKKLSQRDIQHGNLTNGITGISKALMRMSGLQQMFIANSPITYENFFKDIDEDHPFYKEDLSWGNLKNLIDLEIYNCPNLSSLPIEMITELPELQSLNAAVNKGISSENLKQNWTDIADGKYANKLQLLYLGFNNLEEFPEYGSLRNMTMLGLLDVSNNQIHTMHPFGKDVGLVKFYADNNKITKIPNKDGYFFNYVDVEEFSVARNQVEEFPNIFDAESMYIMGSVNLSENLISKFEDGANFKGINASTINLSNNRLTTFPKEIVESGSPVSVLLLAGNGMTEIPEGSMTGKNSRMFSTIDLTYNNLTSLPNDFYATNMPYLYGVDLSYNSFDKFPYEPLDVAYLKVFGIRHQRDAAGNRTLREWPTGIYKHASLGALYIGSNDLRKIDDTISPYINILDIKDNPNISIDVSNVCSYIRAGVYLLIYDKTQDIRGCSALGIEN